MKSKVIVLNFWFKRCKPCLAEIPELDLLTQKYKEKDVVFIALSLDNTEEIKSFLAENKFSYKHIANARSIAKEWDIKGYPTNIVINRSGREVFRSKGLERRAEANGQLKPQTPEYIQNAIERRNKCYC